MTNRQTTLVGLAWLLGACGAPIASVPYTPQPSRITDPAAEVKALIEANTVSNCTTTVEVQPILLVAKSTCTGEAGFMDAMAGESTNPYLTAGSQVVRLDHVGSITIQKSGVWFRVLVHHNNGADDFAWTSKSLDDMTRLADAITALAKSPPP